MARDKNEKVWIGGGAVASLALAGIIWSFFVSPQFDDVDSLKAQTSDAQTENLGLQSKVSNLQQEFAHISSSRRQLEAARAQLPTDTGLSALTNQVSAQARTHHVSITQFTADTPAPLTAEGAGTAPTPTDTASTAPTTPTASTSSAPSGMYSIQVSLAVAGSPSNELAFVRSLQKDGPRSALVSSVQLQNGAASGQPGTTTGSSSMTVQLQVFVASPTAATTSSAAPTATPTAAAAP